MKREVSTAFLEKFSMGAVIKDRTYSVIVEFVPVVLGNQVTDKLGEIERGNGLQPGELVMARWARPPHT